MNIKIKSLSLENFKCFRSKELTFTDAITIVRGRNGVGKTTIADAILWCLFGKNSQGQADFDLKTHDADGKPIPHLDHSVEMQLTTVSDDSVVGKIITLKRTLKETWVKKRGSEELVFKNNTTEYMVNGEVTTATDYKKFISELVSEEIFRAITNPSFFPSLKWQQQRAFLTSLVDDIEEEEICGNDESLKGLQSELNDSGEDIVAYRKHLSYQIKKIKDKLDKIPVRLEEQNKALPERLAWGALTALYNAVTKECQDIEAKILTIKQGNADDIRRETIRKQLKDLDQQMGAFEEKVRQEVKAEEDEHNERLRNASLRFNEAVTNQRLLEQNILADERLIARAKETDYESELQKLRDQWPSSKFSVDPDLAYCPTCGQLIPEDQFKERIAEMRNKFNLDREAKIKQLNARAANVKKEQADAEEEIARLTQKLSDDKQEFERIKQSINTIFAEKADIEKLTVKPVQERLAENQEYIDIQTKKISLIERLDEVATEDNTELLDSLEVKRKEISEQQEQLTIKLASKQQYDKIQSLIDQINEEKKELIAQLSELERAEDIARNYQDRQNTILEERINKHFSLVRWRMFRTVNNGGEPFDEPFCECYVNGVAYHDGLNQASRLNAGLDIVNALCKHYNVYAPIVVDNSESTLNIIPTTSQQIRLEVADTDLQLI